MRLGRAFRSLRAYPFAWMGGAVVAFLLGLAGYALVRYPYAEVVRLWQGSAEVWLENPRNAAPAWVNLFGGNRPPTLRVAWDDAAKTTTFPWPGVEETTAIFAFDFSYDAFPSELAVFLKPTYTRIPPHVRFFWRMPNGEEFFLSERTVEQAQRYVLSGDRDLTRRLGGRAPEIALFESPREAGRPLKGTYHLVAKIYTFEPGDALEAKLVVYGRVHGLGGTDHLRRDLALGLLWGTPPALAFGVAAALGVFLFHLIFSAAGAWWGGWVDAVVERLTELRLVVPLIPFLAMVGMFWSRSLWAILGALLGYNLLGGEKTFRAILMQARAAPYLEAARAYGAGPFRLIVRYLIPQVLPALIPSVVVAIPGYIFLEASLALLGLGEPLWPTWGKILEEAHREGALYLGQYYWVLEPVALLFLTGTGFTLLGLSLERVFNPRLRRV